MVTDFIDEHNGFLRLSESEIEKRDHLGLNIPPIAREILLVGEDHARNHCNYSFEFLQRIVTPAMESVTLDLIRKYFRKSRDYLHAYDEGTTGLKANEAVKLYKAHRKYHIKKVMHSFLHIVFCFRETGIPINLNNIIFVYMSISYVTICVVNCYSYDFQKSN